MPVKLGHPERVPERVIVIDGHALVRDGLRTVLQQAFGCAVLEAADLPEAAERMAAAGKLDLILLDLPVSGREGLSDLKTLRARFPETPVAIVSGLTDPNAIHGALAAGAAGFLPKSLQPGDLLSALRQVLAGATYRPAPPETAERDAHAAEQASIRARIDSLTPQQRVVLGRLTAGMLNKQIAYELDVSMTTVKAHVSAILQKMQVLSRTQAVILANRIDFRG